MKKIVNLFVAMLIVASLFVCCKKPDDSGQQGKPNIGLEEVDEVELPATSTVEEITYVSSKEDVEKVFASMAEDPAVLALIEMIGSLGSSESLSRQAYDKVTVEDIMEIVMGENGYEYQLEEFIKALEEEGSAKIDINDTFGSIDLSELVPENLIKIEDIKLKLNADVSYEENEETYSMKGNAKGKVAVGGKIIVDPTVYVPTTGFGKITCNLDDLNAKVDGGFEMSMNPTTYEKDIKVSGSAEADVKVGLGWSYISPEGLGGRFVIDASYSAKIKGDKINALIQASGERDEEAIIDEEAIMQLVKDVVTVNITFNVYDNNGKATYTTNYNLDDILELLDGIDIP